MKYSLYFLVVLILVMILHISLPTQIPTNPKMKLNKPNIIVIFTDQERNHQHWPDGWAQKHLPNFERLKKHGLLFHNAFTSASECSPSRAVMVSGQHFPNNNVPVTLNASKGNPLPTYDQLKNVGSVLSNHGYKVIWKGKWHLTLPLEGEYKWTKQDIDVMKNNYKLNGWNPPDAGNAIDNMIKDKSGTYSGLLTLGGGTVNNDGRFTYGENGVLDELDTIQEPFCLFVSLVNPHDVWVHPQFYREAGYFKENFENMGIELPPNMNDNLSTKPSVQKLVKDSFDKESPITPDKYREYCNFYAYLHTLNDRHIGDILDKLESKQLMRNSIIIRTADHGEMGLSHGMREKAYVIYEEVIHVPLVISNPILFPNPAETQSLYCHLDLFPTICDLIGIPSNLPGKSIVPILLNPETEVQDNILFKFDDTFFLPPTTKNSHILAIRTKQYTFGVYFSENSSDYEFELYDNVNDKYQLHNLMYNTKLEDSPIANQLYEKMMNQYNSQIKN
jgi:choline-sulfatase